MTLAAPYFISLLTSADCPFFGVPHHSLHDVNTFSWMFYGWFSKDPEEGWHCEGVVGGGPGLGGIV